MNARADRWIRWITIGCVAMLALIAGTVSYLHMHDLVARHGPAWVGRRADAVAGGRDDRGGVYDVASRLAIRPAGRGSAGVVLAIKKSPPTSG